MRYTFIVLFLPLSLLAQTSSLQQEENLYEKSLEELVNIQTPLKADIGSRSGDRDYALSEVPIDVITAQQIRHSGATELTRVLEKFIPGFNSPRSSITDGSDHSRIFTLRGLNPDQVLVLVNGKRLHQSSLMNVNQSIGRGTSGTDLNTIPLVAIEKIEVLRDGAAAQYGSDAIAGVINIILKGYGHSSEANTRYGVSAQGDGELKEGDLFYSIPLEYEGFFNIAAEYRDRESTNRAGADPRAQYPSGDSRNDLPDPINTHYGDPDSSDLLLSINSEIVTQDSVVFYLHGIYNQRESSAGGFFRRPIDANNNPNIYPDGFLPMQSAKIEDYSLTLGLKGVFSRDIVWDLSYTRGSNDMQRDIYNTHNDSLGDSSPTSFYTGSTQYIEDIINLDVSKQIGDFNIAGGLEFRRENYIISSGEEGSYALGSYSNLAGAQAASAFSPLNEIDETRYNIAGYIDTQYKPTPEITLGLALRYEDYSDFGSTFDQKISAMYKAKNFLVRASASSGFRAPSLTQSYYNQTVSGSTNGQDIYQKGTFATNHPVSIALGATPLESEKSTHFSAGFVYFPYENFSFSADYFYTTIDDRIMLTRNLSTAGLVNNYGVSEARYFTNALDTKTDGVDVRINYKYNFENDSLLKVMASYHYNNNQITNYLKSDLTSGVAGEKQLFEVSSYIENSQPKESVKIFTQYFIDDFIVSLNLNRYGAFSMVLLGEEQHFGASLITDLELSYEVAKGFNVSFGAENLFDIYPQQIGATPSPLVGEGGVINYSQYSPNGFNGAFYYIRAGIAF